MKRSPSITLSPDNRVWLAAQARKLGTRSLSATLDAVLREARGAGPGPPRSVVGTVVLPDGVEGLRAGEAEVEASFRVSLEQWRLPAASVRRRRGRRR